MGVNWGIRRAPGSTHQPDASCFHSSVPNRRVGRNKRASEKILKIH